MSITAHAIKAQGKLTKFEQAKKAGLKPVSRQQRQERKHEQQLARDLETMQNYVSRAEFIEHQTAHRNLRKRVERLEVALARKKTWPWSR